MGMDIEVVGRTWYTVHLTDEDVEKIKKYIKNHEDDLPSFDMRNECELELYSDGKATESDFSTEDIDWSECEERTPEEILGE